MKSRLKKVREKADSYRRWDNTILLCGLLAKKFIDTDDEGLDQIEMTILNYVDGKWIAESEKFWDKLCFHKTFTQLVKKRAKKPSFECSSDCGAQT